MALPARPQRRRANVTPEIGSTGLRAYGGFVDEEFLKELSGQRANRVYREMSDNDAVCGAILFVITMMIRQVEWQVVPATEDQAGEDAAAMVEGALFDDMDTSWDALMSEICTMFAFGHAVMEVVWKIRSGDSEDPSLRSAFADRALAPARIGMRGQETLYRWNIDDAGRILGVWQTPWTSPEVYIPADRFLLFRTAAVKNNPLGKSILRTAYRSWFFKKRIEEIEGIGVERDLAGYPVMRIPGRLMDGNASAAEKALFTTYKDLVTRVRRNQSEGLVLPSDRDEAGNLLYELTLLSSPGQRVLDTTKIVDRYDRRIAMSVLADFIFLGQQAVGSFALSSDKTAMFATAVGGWLKSIATTLNRDLIGRMWAMNGFDPALRPRLVPGDIERPNLVELAGYITALAGAGAPLFPDRDLENHLRTVAGLPMAPEDDGGEAGQAEAEAAAAGDDDDEAGEDGEGEE